ncbi:MAG: hypothetical protein ACLFN8_03980 [Candidatus Woesearchaeota archaeon]
MKKTLHTLTIIGTLAAGYLIGKNIPCHTQETEKYEIIQRNQDHYLRSKEQNKTYIIQETPKNLYIGTSEDLKREAIQKLRYDLYKTK